MNIGVINDLFTWTGNVTINASTVFFDGRISIYISTVCSISQWFWVITKTTLVQKTCLVTALRTSTVNPITPCSISITVINTIDRISFTSISYGVIFLFTESTFSKRCRVGTSSKNILCLI